MNFRTCFTAGILFAGLASLPVLAQTPPEKPLPAPAVTTQVAPAKTPDATPMQPTGPGNKLRGPRDCSRMHNPQACEKAQATRQHMRETCGKLKGPQRQQCMIDEMQKIDCSQSKDAQRCEARKQAARDCSGQPGKAFRQCMHDRMPPVDCSKSPNPQRCEMHKKAHEACRDKQGDERRACMQAQRPPR